MMSYGYDPASFGRSYAIPLPKGNAILGKALTVDDFRGISISPVFSKIFKHCILDRLSSFLATTDNQFDFKKDLCSLAPTLWVLRGSGTHEKGAPGLGHP